MIRIQLDQMWREWLFCLDKMIEFCDETGNVVGQFVPNEEVQSQAARQQYLAVTNDERDRVRDEEGGRSQEEILRDLKKARSAGQ